MDLNFITKFRKKIMIQFKENALTEKQKGGRMDEQTDPILQDCQGSHKSSKYDSLISARTRKHFFNHAAYFKAFVNLQ